MVFFFFSFRGRICTGYGLETTRSETSDFASYSSKWMGSCLFSCLNLIFGGLRIYCKAHQINALNLFKSGPP